MFRNFNAMASTYIKNSVTSTLTPKSPVLSGSTDLPCLETSEEFHEGCVILTEDALTTFPRFDDFNGSNLCVACCKVLQGCSVHCSACQLPVCGLDCEKLDQHDKLDCKIFSLPRMSQVLGSSHRATKKYRKQMYMLVAVFRCLSLKLMDPDKWNLIEELMKIPCLDEKAVCLSFVDSLEFVGEILLTAKQVFEAKEQGVYVDLASPPGHDEMVKICDLFVSVNCILTKFGLCFWPENMQNGMMSLLYTAGRIQHDCNPNSAAVMNSEGSVKLVAGRNLNKGTQVTMARHFSHSLWFIQGYHYRETSLKQQFLTHEHCSLCFDCSDKDSGISCVKCSYCKQAFMMPVDDKLECVLCKKHASFIGPKQFKAIKFYEYYHSQKNLETFDKLAKDIADLEDKLCPFHFVVLALKTHYIKQIHLYKNATQDSLKKVLIFGDQISTVLKSVQRGISYYKGMISFCLHYAHEIYLERVDQSQSDLIHYHWNQMRKNMIKVDRNWSWRDSHSTLSEEKEYRAMLATHYEKGICSSPTSD